MKTKNVLVASCLSVVLCGFAAAIFAVGQQTALQSREATAAAGFIDSIQAESSRYRLRGDLGVSEVLATPDPGHSPVRCVSVSVVVLDGESTRGRVKSIETVQAQSARALEYQFGLRADVPGSPLVTWTIRIAPRGASTWSAVGSVSDLEVTLTESESVGG